MLSQSTAASFIEPEELKALKQIIQNDHEGLRKTLQANHESWPKWMAETVIDVSTWTTIEQESNIYLSQVNLLQFAVIKKNIECVRAIIKVAKEIGSLFWQNLLIESMVQALGDLYAGELPENFSWLREANAVHLSAWFHEESLAYFIQLDSKLKDNQDNLCRYSPLHISAMKHNAIATRLLLNAKANVHAKSLPYKQTPLHLAAKANQTSNIIALLMNGGEVTSLDTSKKSPMHYCNSQHLDIFLRSKINADQVLGIEDLWKHILKYHPSCLSSYLDMMVTTSKSDLNSASDQYLIFNLKPFYTKTCHNVNFLDKHRDVIHYNQSYQLKHPLMQLFSQLKSSGNNIG